MLLGILTRLRGWIEGKREARCRALRWPSAVRASRSRPEMNPARGFSGALRARKAVPKRKGTSNVNLPQKGIVGSRFRICRSPHKSVHTRPRKQPNSLLRCGLVQRLDQPRACESAVSVGWIHLLVLRILELAIALPPITPRFHAIVERLLCEVTAVVARNLSR